MNKQKCGDSSNSGQSSLLSEGQRAVVLKMQAFIVMKIYNANFIREEITPDLMKKFGMRFVKRTSSAVWRTPPRYSTLPKY
jgi:hypothetical protein